jgi:hypothetical protein
MGPYSKQLSLKLEVTGMDPVTFPLDFGATADIAPCPG